MDSFWQAVSSSRSDVARALYARYTPVPRAYVARYFLGLCRQNPGNPRALLYLDSELGAPDRAAVLLGALESTGISIAGARCLDIGCANGALLLAAAIRGAGRVVGVEIAARRARAVRRMTRGRDVEFLALDIATEELPRGYGPFDRIFCIDTLEHVSSAAATLTAIKRHLDAGPWSLAFVSVFNPHHPENVAVEPHYGVPAMVLLPHDDARSLWTEVRTAFGSRLEYEVSDWIPHRTLVEMLRSAGFSSAPFVDSRPILDRDRPFWVGFRERCSQMEARVTAGIAGLSARPALRELLLTNLHLYCSRFMEDHLALSSSVDASDEALLAFFMDYYAHTIQLVIRHADHEGWASGESGLNP